MGNINKTLSYLKRNGIIKTAHMVRQRINENKQFENYEALRQAEVVSSDELKRQSSQVRDTDFMFSILVPVYNTPEDYLRKLVDSILVQSYERFELVIVDASSDAGVANIIAEYDDDSRVVYSKLDDNKGIAENTNVALGLAKGDAICLVDHDDFVEPDALFCLYQAFADGAEMVYTDEDKYDDIKGIYNQPNRKPDYNKDMFLSNNYICHLTAVNTDIARSIGGFRKEYDGAQDYDFFLRCIENIEQRHSGEDVKSYIKHIPKVLYHWRASDSSTAMNPDSKQYAYEAGRMAIMAYLKRQGIRAIVEHTEHRGFYRISYDVCDKISRNQMVWTIPPSAKGLDSELESRMISYFSRPDVRTVCGRCLDKRNVVIDGPYSGMAEWDSGIMHRAHIQQDIDEVTQLRVTNPSAEGTLIVYDPSICLHV